MIRVGNKNQTAQSNSGFTILELMIVLAIASLILLVIFVILPQVQRETRDNTRQSIAQRVMSEIETYANNHEGGYPFRSQKHTNGVSCNAVPVGCIYDFVDTYIGTGTGPPTTCSPPNGRVDTCDPSLDVPMLTGASFNRGEPVEWPDPPSTKMAQTINTGDLYIVYGAKCDGENLQQAGLTNNPVVTTRYYAIVVGLDRDHTDYCIDNS